MGCSAASPPPPGIRHQDTETYNATTRAGQVGAARNLARGSDAEQVVHGELVKLLERHSAGRGGLDVEVLEGAAVREQVRELLAGRECGLGELVEPRRLKRLPHRLVGTEGGGPLAQDQIVAHAAG